MKAGIRKLNIRGAKHQSCVIIIIVTARFSPGKLAVFCGVNCAAPRIHSVLHPLRNFRPVR